MSDVITTTQYEARSGAIAILHNLLPSPQWYKDDPKQAKTIVRAVEADDALPLTEKLEQGKDESDSAWEARYKVWAGITLIFHWTDEQKAVAKKCVTHYIKGGNLAANRDVASLVKLLQIED